MNDRLVTVARKVKFWYPHTATFDTATYAFTMKAPEEQNTFKKQRNQSIVRTRAANTLVYDRGTNFNNMMTLDFKYINDGVRAQLIVFLEAVQWGSSIVAYQDMYGDVYFVRVIADTGVTYSDQGVRLKGTPTASSIIQWNFNLDLLDLTDNTEELADPEPPVSGALALHLRDFNDPHDPKTTITVQVSEGFKTVESFATNLWKTIVWIALVTKGAKECTYIINGGNNRDGSTAATTTDTVIEQLSAIGDTPSKIAFQTVLSGSGAAQMMSLQVGTTEDGYTVQVRRTKL